MVIEPYEIGTALSVASGASAFGSMGPIPAGVRILYVTVIAEVQTTKLGAVAITMAESPAKALADMVRERPIFDQRAANIGPVVTGQFFNAFGSLPVMRRYSWNLEPVVGPFWINVAISWGSTIAFSVAFGAVGFRRMKPVEDP